MNTVASFILACYVGDKMELKIGIMLEEREFVDCEI